ncbi:dienelactone hydrolase family protein [Novosphingobium sp.]|uniref:dienelactone hydrolase family protein n=1 Tax=Novosphingobium sp. TaxID=1874826 RepID=UPI0038B78EFA
MKNRQAFAGYEAFEFTDGPWTRRVWRKGHGPAVIVMHEMPNLHPQVLRFADRVAAQGMTVYCPSLFGEDGRIPGRLYTMGQMIAGICIRREFNVWANGRSSPIVEWLRALARKAHADCGGRGVGAVGMCFTGGFALAMMTEPSVVAPVLSQPSLPLGKKGAGMIDASPQEIACAKRRLKEEDLTIMALRFPSDGFVPDERFAMLKETFGERCVTVELPDADANTNAPIPPHSVLTWHLIDEPDSATKQVEQDVIAFFKHRTAA